MISTDVKSARSFLSDEEYNQAIDEANKAWQKVKNQSGAGSEWLGWRRILKEPNDAELERITSHAERIRKDADVFIVVGTSLAVYPAAGLVDYSPNGIPKYLVDPAETEMRITSNWEHIQETAAIGLPSLAKKLSNNR